MHIWPKVIGYIQGHDFTPRPFIEIINLADGHIRFIDPDEIVSIRTCMFVPKTECVTDFVSYRAILEMNEHELIIKRAYEYNKNL